MTATPTLVRVFAGRAVDHRGRRTGVQQLVHQELPGAVRGHPLRACRRCGGPVESPPWVARRTTVHADKRRSLKSRRRWDARRTPHDRGSGTVAHKDLVAGELRHGFFVALVINECLASRSRGDERGNGGVVERTRQAQAGFDTARGATPKSVARVGNQLSGSNGHSHPSRSSRNSPTCRQDVVL